MENQLHQIISKKNLKKTNLQIYILQKLYNIKI